MTPILSGRCSCGEVRYRVEGTVRDRCYCHCESCRRAVGAPFVAWGTVDSGNFSATGKIAVIGSSEHVTRGFCERCGTTLTYQHALRSHEIDFTLVSLDDANALPPERHIWVRDKLSWVTLDDDLPQYATVVGEESP